MFYLAAFFAGVISLLSPFWGLIFTLAYCGRFQEKYLRFLGISVLPVLSFFLLGNLDMISLLDILIGVALTIYAFIALFERKGDYILSFLSAYVINAGYFTIRQIIFNQKLTQNIQDIIMLYRSFLETSLQNNPNQLQIGMEILQSTENIFTRYFVGISAVSIALAIYLGMLFFSRFNLQKLNHKMIRIPYELIYPLIIGLMAMIFTNYRFIGVNVILIMAPIFLLQGVSILDFYWGNFFKKSKILLFLLIISLVFNYFILSLIILIGLIDMWFNFRKID
jgi:hypothetical protein